MTLEIHKNVYERIKCNNKLLTVPTCMAKLQQFVTG